MENVNFIDKDFDYDAMIDEVCEEGKWINREPRRYTKQVAGYTKNKIILESFNQFLAYQEDISEKLGMKPHELIGDMRRIDLALGFAHFLQASLEEQVKVIDEEQKAGLY